MSRSASAIQQQILDAIAYLHSERQYWPSQRVVRTSLGIPRSTVRYHIRILEAEKRLERLEDGRILRLLPRTNDVAS